jgi:hypothetical protein
MDETPEELDQIRREAAEIDPYRYRRHRRWLITVLIFAAGAGVCWLAVTMASAGRNPCERVRDHYCLHAKAPAKCASYKGIFDESVQDQSPAMRSMIRDQCLTKINRLKDEEGVSVR